MKNPEHCMLGLFEHSENRIKFYVGCGWNINSPLPKLKDPWENRGSGVAGWQGTVYQCGWLHVYGKRLTRPFLGRYGGLHRTEAYDPFRQNHSYVGRHRVKEAP